MACHIYASRAKTLISPSKAHMSVWRFCCVLIIEYKCKTSNINKRNEQWIEYQCKLLHVNKELYNRNM